ncbi:MAG: 2Fe-2S iron-sulfur cluster binding domain-containing protein [Thalassotalea sp.]|nr:2Fe-2S iron-sulfur cluster binding domain-containing protein [Thalassotalea sp.]
MPVSAKLNIQQGKRSTAISIDKDETLLSAMLRQGVDADYSCEAGVCGSCQCTLISGEVSMIENLFLTDEEQAKGRILACQAQAESADVSIKL